MHVLFIHKNFPAQFRYIAPRLVREQGWQCSFLTAQKKFELPGVEKLVYETHGGATLANHVCTRNFENAVAQASSVYERLKEVPDLQPDLIIAHAGFGSSLFLPHLFDAPIINFFEYYYRPVGGDMGYRPESPVTEESLLRVRTKNAMLLLDLDNCTRGWTPTHYQRDFLPAQWQPKIDVIFDGIDTDIYYRRKDSRARLACELELPSEARVVTYVARGFEYMRGFDVFMEAARQISEQFADVVFVVVGEDSVHYGNDLERTGGKPLREYILSKERFDLSRFRFTGRVSEDRLADILSLSDVHIYLTEPFIASWSMVDAMSCGAVVLASDQSCVREYIVPGENGLLVDFFDVDALAHQAIDILHDPEAFRHLGEAAQQTVADRYSVDVAMPRLVEFFQRISRTRRNPSLLASRLVRKGGPETNRREGEAVAAADRVYPTRLVEPAPTKESREAAAQLRRLTANVSLRDLPAECQRFRGPAPWFEQVGPHNHPEDLNRLLVRVHEWQPRTVIDIGDDGGGRTLLWTRTAASDARILIAGIPGLSDPVMKMTFLNALAHGRQTVRCVTKASSQAETQRRVQELLSRRSADLLWLDGWRPFLDVTRDFEFYSRVVRPGGLIAWDGIGGHSIPLPSHDGGYRLWQNLKPRFPRHAEYLSGVSLPRRGIAVIVMK